MIRMIFKRTVFDTNANLREEEFETKDIELPEVEKLLMRGGSGQGGFDCTSFVGLEIIAVKVES